MPQAGVMRDDVDKAGGGGAIDVDCATTALEARIDKASRVS